MYDVKKIVWNKYTIFTVCFWAFIGLLVYYISSIGLCAVGVADAVSQHYPAMVYVRSLWVDFWSALLHGEKYVFPMVNFSLGMGEDTITALHYYGLGDPFYMLTALVSEENLSYFYSVLFYLRVYLGGIAFIAFVSELDSVKSMSAYVMGALVYSFTGFTLQSNMHIIFVHAMFYTPLVFLGAERLMNHKRKGLLCIATCCFALSGFYFLYIASVSLAVYIVYRMIRREIRFPQAVRGLCVVFSEYLLGIGWSAVLFVPAVVGFLRSGRADANIQYPLVLSWEEIKNLLKNMFFPSYSNNGQELAISTLGMVVLICVLLSKEKWREKGNCIALFAVSVIPFFSYVMSGFNACYSRWELVIDLYIAFLVFVMWDNLRRTTMIQKAGIVFVYMLLGLIGKREDILTHERFGNTIISYGLIACSVIVVIPLLNRLKKEKAGMYLLFAVGYLTICMNWKAVARDNDIEMVQGRQAVRELRADEGQEENFYRIDNERGFAEPRYGMNISMQQGYYGTMSYVSITNDYYAHAFQEWDISSAGFNIWGLDQRAVLETMCAVKYFVVREEKAGIVPYGFEYVRSTEDREWSLYENAHSLPLVYAYDSIYDLEEYKMMSGLGKQQVMLQAAAIEGINTGGGV